MRRFGVILVILATIIVALTGCDSPGGGGKLGGDDDGDDDNSITSEGSIDNPVELSFSADNIISIGKYESPSYYKMLINENNYYDSIVTAITGNPECYYQVFSDAGFSVNHDGSTNTVYRSTLNEIKLYKGKTYFFKITNLSGSSGISFKLRIKGHTSYPPLNVLPISYTFNGTIGNYGVTYSKQYFAFTTTQANFYTVIRSYPAGKQINETLFEFMPDDGNSLGGTFTNTNSVYSLKANTTYYVTITSSYAQPLSFSLVIVEGSSL